MVFRLTLFFAILFFPFVVGAQQFQSDSLFQKSKALLAEKKFEESKVIAKSLVESDPKNTDYIINLANLHNWSDQYDTAIQLLLPLTLSASPSADAIQALCNAYLWKGDYEQSIKIAEQRLSVPGADSVFLLSNLAIAYQKVQKDSISLALIKKVHNLDRGNDKMLALKSSILQKRKNHFALSYYNISFRAPYNRQQHIAFAEYKRNFSKAPLLLRLNYGQMFGKESLQYEFDVYPKINKNSYIYINQAFSSQQSVFPNYKAGVEYFVTMAQRVTSSLGARFLQFQSSSVWIGTMHIGYQYKNWQPNYRLFLSTLGAKQFLSHSLMFKRDFFSRESFLQMEFQYGNMPYSFFTTNEISRINAYRFGIQYKFRFCNHFFLQPIFMYEYEEYFPGSFRDRYNTQIILTHRF